MNNHDENKKYFKSTFKVFHAPDNTAKEVLDMAKKLNQEDNTNSNQDMISYQVESVSHHNFGKWIAVTSACVLIVGSGVYFNNLGSENVSSKIGDSSVSLGLSTQVDDKLFGRFDMPSKVTAKLLAHSSENSDIISYLTAQDLTKLNPLINYQNWIELSTYPAEFDNDVMYPYFAELDFQTNDGEYIRLEIIDQYVLIYHTDENYEHYSNVEYYQYDFNNDISFFETFKQLLENNATQQVDNVQNSTNTKFMGMFNASNITISYQQKDKNNYTINDLSKSNISANDVDLINSAIDLNTCTEIDENTFREHNPKYNENLLNSDINLDNASIKFTDGNKLFNIYIVNDVMVITHFTSNGEIRLYDGYYLIENTTLLDTIRDILPTNSNVPILNDINVILNDLIPNSVAIIDENGTLTECSATENYDLSEINDILQAQEWTVQPVQEGNQESAIIFCTDYTYNQDDNNIFIENTSYAVLYQDGSLYVNNNNTRGMVYSQNGSQLYNTIYDKLINMQNEYTFQQTTTLFGVVEIPTNATVYYSTSSDDLHYNSEKEHYTDEIEFSGTLNAQAIQKINELSNTTLWTKIDEPPYAGQSVICINLNDSYSGYGCSFAMYDNGIAITYEDNTEEYYIVDNNLIQQIISVIDEYAEPTTFRTDSHNLFGIIPMDESTSFNAVISSSTGGESACILNYFDLLKINELSCYNMWQQLTDNPISQDFYYETCVSLKNDNYSIQILDTTIIVTYPDGTVEYYSTMETCGTDTFAQSVQSLVYERSQTQIID